MGRRTERLWGRLISHRGEQVLGVLALAALVASGILSLVVAPPDAVQGNVQRLMYVHVPTAWLAYLAFTVVLIGSVAYLRTGRGYWDSLAAASAEIGVLFTGLTIALGSLWGKPVWGTWWTWDPRLTTTAILLFIYVGYLAVRRLPNSPTRRARWAAVVGIAGFIDVPIVHLSVVWWRSLHQPATVLQPGKPAISGLMLAALLFGVFAFSLAYAYLLGLRMRVGRLEQRVMATTLVPQAEAGLRPHPAHAGNPATLTTVAPPEGAGQRADGQQEAAAHG